MITNKHRGQRTGTTRSNKKVQATNVILSSQGIIISWGGYPPFHDGPKSDFMLLPIKISHEITF